MERSNERVRKFHAFICDLDVAEYNEIIVQL